MNEQRKGHCPHGEFDLLEGCPQCIAEARVDREATHAEAYQESLNMAAGREPDPFIVKVKYYSETSGKYSDREYAYFSVDALGVGQLVQAPVGDNRVVKAVVTATDVPEAEIEAFRERVKTIPSGSIRPGPTSSLAGAAKAAGAEVTEVELPAAETPPVAQVASLFDQAPPLEEGAALEPSTVTLCVHGENADTCPECEKERTRDWLNAKAAAEQYGTVSGEMPDPPQDEGEPVKPAALVTIECHVGKPVPELLQRYLDASGLLQFAKDRIIATNEDLKPATDDLAIIAKCKKAMFERKNEIVGPFKARLDAINQAFADLMFPVLEADRLTRLQVTEYDNKVRAQAAEAKRIEDEKFKLAQAEKELTGGEHTQELGTAVAPPPVPEHTRTDLGTLGGRANWKARVVDFGLLPDEYKLPNEPLLNSFARSTKGTRPIPGVEFFDDRIVTMRTK